MPTGADALAVLLVEQDAELAERDARIAALEEKLTTALAEQAVEHVLETWHDTLERLSA